MKRMLVGLTILASATVAQGQTALSVRGDTLWRVDLRTHAREAVYSFVPPDPRPYTEFWCSSLAASRSGELRCLGTPAIIDIRPGTAQVLGPLPHGDIFGALAFDADGRLWWTGGRFLQELDPATGAMISERWLLLDPGCYTHALMARGNHLFVIIGCSASPPVRVEEIDPWTGASLSTVGWDSSLGVGMPRDAEFDAAGDLWLLDNYQPSYPYSTYCSRFWRLHLSPLSAEMTSEECVPWPLGATVENLAAIEGTGVIEVPAVSPLGAFVFVLLLAAAGWFRLGRGESAA